MHIREDGNTIVNKIRLKGIKIYVEIYKLHKIRDCFNNQRDNFKQFRKQVKIKILLETI